MKTIGIVLRDYETKNGGIVYGVRNYLIEKLKNYNVSIMCIPFDFENNEKIDTTLIDNILNICSKSEFSENNLVSQDDLYGNSTLILKDNIQTNFSKRRN